MEEQLKKENKVWEGNENLYQLPRNIRQIGQGEHKINVYIEDYVISFVNYLGKKSTVEHKIAVFLGDVKELDGKKHVFVHGVLEVKDIKLEGNCCFSKEIWKDIYRQIEENFKCTNIVGWLITKAGMLPEPSEQIRKIHLENFSGPEKILMLYDSLEREEKYYIFEQKKFTELSGYYIYYDKNQDMQEYMLKVKGVAQQEQVEEHALTQMRSKIDKMVENKHKKERIRWYAKGGIAIVLFVMVGVGVTHKMTQYQVDNVWNNMEQAALKESIPKETPEVHTTFIEEEPAKVTISREEIIDDKIKEFAKEPEKESVREDIKDVQKKEKWNNVEQYYTIQPGDTLVRICMEKFQSLEQMETIMEINQIENENKIVAGKKIKLWQ